MASGASFTAVTVIVAVAGDGSCRPSLSIAAYWKVGDPLKFGFGTKNTVAALPPADTVSFRVITFNRPASA